MDAAARRYEASGFRVVGPAGERERRAGQGANKKAGVKSEVYAYEIEDLGKMLKYFEENGKWIHYLLLTFGCNMARRVGDTLQLRWKNLYDPETGEFRRDILEIREDKTDKLANPRINKAVRDAVGLYVEKTGCRPEEDGYGGYVFMQLSGTHKGSLLTESGHLKALKSAARAVGIGYNVGTHSARKFFGKMTRMLHPGDYDSMEILRTIYNHSDTKMTSRYIGLTKQKVDGYYDDMGEFFGEYVVGGREFGQVAEKPVVSLDVNDLRDIVRAAYQSGMENAGVDDAMAHVDAVGAIMEMAGQLAR